MRLTLDAPIVEVTVYPDRALVTRRGAVAVPSTGEHEIALGQLPRTLAKESLRATGRGSASARLLGVDLADEYYATAPETETQRIQAEIDRLTRDLSTLDQRIALIEQQRGWLSVLGEQAARTLARLLLNGEAQPEDSARIFSVTREESERLTSDLLDAQRDRQRVADELDARRRELDTARGQRGPDRLQAIIRVQAMSAGVLVCEVSYLTYSASWVARYDARVDTDTGVLRFSQQAQVQQWSGEDWPGVSLAVSTARPSAALALPDDAPAWYLDHRAPFQPQRMYAASAPMRAPRATGALEEALPMAAMMAPEDEATFTNMEVAAAPVEHAGAAQVFRIGGDSSIPSDGQPHAVGLGDDDLPIQLEYVAAPVVADGVHLRAVTTNSAGHALPAGALRVFHVSATGDEYVGETQLQATAEGASLKLYLGVNDNMTVKRELVERDTDKASLLQGNMRRTTIGYRVTLANRTSATQHVILLDRLPVPRHERIKVKPLDIRPQPSSQTKLDQLTWTLQLAPGEERRIEWRFLVESAPDLNVTGLP
ncbi:MAG TPA: mucoidy inhibitor MuiA family protein [Ktedonobacterales bacterium]